MNTPRVQLLMIVYNSFSYERSDGKKLLPLAINSLLRQTYKDFELIILDNQSTDDTSKICREYAEKDSRVRFIVDDQKRIAEGAITKLGNMATAHYCMIINDDDMWDARYIEEAVAYMDSHPQTDMVYGKGFFINPENMLVGLYIPKENEKYGEGMTTLERFVRYSNLRNILPMHYGLFRTETFKKTLPYEDFDTLKSNVDNVFMSKFFASGYQADYCEKLSFFYRRKSRVLTPSKFASNMPQIDNPIGIWLFYTHHQMLFFAKLLDIAKQKGFTGKDLEQIKSSVLASCIHNSLNLIRWTKQEIQSQGKFLEAEKILKIEKAYRESQINSIASYKKFIENAANEAGDNESKDFASKIIGIIDNNSVNDTDLDALISTKKDHSILEVIRNYPLLKKMLIGMLSIYLTVRFYPLYHPLMKDTKNKE